MIRRHTAPALAGTRPGLDALLAAAAGLLVTAGLPPLAWTSPLVVAGLALLAAQLLRSGRPGLTGWVFGLAHQGSLLVWLFFLDPAKSIPTRALVPAQATATIIYVSVFYLGVGWAFGRLRRRFGAGRALALLPALWAVMEGLRAKGEMAFPWCLVGSAVLDTPLRVLLRAGEPAVGAAIVFLATTLGAAWGARANRSLAGTARVLAGGSVVLWLALGGAATLRPAAPPPEPSVGPLRSVPLAVAAVQADVALADKWDAAKLDSTRVPYGRLTAAAAREGAEFIVWAETAVPGYVRFEESLLTWLRGVVREAGVPLFTGFPDAERSPDGNLRKFNSSGLFGGDGVLRERYAKHHLLPIGEAMPFTSVLPFLARIDVGQAEWSPGPAPRPIALDTADGAFPFSALICFESAFGALARDAVRAGSRCLVVITNDGWFGRTSGPRQHAALARLRAVECDVPVVRCANNGISFISDGDGRLLDQLGLGRRGLVSAAITPGAAATVYVRWGDTPLVVALLLWLAVVLIGLPRGAGEEGRER